MRFPFPLGDGVFDAETRQEKAQSFLDRITGHGGFTDDPESVIRHTLSVIARGLSSVSLSCDRLAEQIFPADSHSDDLLADWEKILRISRAQPDTVESRRQALGDVFSDKNGSRSALGQGSGRGIDIKQYLERVVGKGNCKYKYNKAADIIANGWDPRAIFAIAFEVPIGQITTVGQIERLRKIVEIHKPTHVGAAITRDVERGFLVDDAPLSLLDRDVVRI